MSDDAKIQRLREGYQPGKDEVAKGSIRRKQGSYRPRNNEVTKGYRPTQQVDMSNLKIPKNLRDAAAMPRNSGNSVHTSVEPKKE